MTVEGWPLAKILPYEHNAKRHNVAWIAKSIADFKPDQPIVVDGAGVIIKGHGRLKAAQALGLTEFPVIVRTDLTPEQVRLARIADNRSNEGGWDAETLELELNDLMGRLPDYDFSGIGVNDDWLAELNELAAEDTPLPFTDEAADALPDAPDEPITQPGDLFALGKHVILCGDSTNPQDVARLMSGKIADCVLTDPPYGQNQTGVTNDEPEKLAELIIGSIRCLPIQNGIVVAFQSPRTFPCWLDAIRQRGFAFERMLWMYKAAQCTFPWRGWLLKSEAILASSIGEASWNEVHPFSHDCYYLSEVSGEIDASLGWHGSVKPMSVVSDILQRIGIAGQICFDGFLGSGTTLIAAEKTGRVCLGVECNPRYVDITIRRFETLVGEKAKKL